MPDKDSSSPEFLRHWRIVTVAGLLGMTYYKCCILGAPRTKFLVELGATPFDFGLIAGLGALAMVFQLLSGMVANRLHRRKRIWMTLFIVHRLVFIGVLAAPGLFDDPRARIWWIIAVLCVHSSLTHLGDPLWFSWMSDLVPRDDFTQHWARRQRFITFGSIVTEIVIALWFHEFEMRGEVIRGFVLLGIGGLVLGVIDICMFAAVPEPEHDRDRDVRLRDALIEPLRSAMFRPFLIFRTYWMFAIMLGAPFFQVYLIGEMGLSVMVVQILFALHGLGIAMASGTWGRICDSHGFRPVLQFVVMFKFIVPLTYVLVPQVPVIALPVFGLMFFFDGMLNAAGNLAMQGVALRSTPRRNRAMYVATANFLAMGLAAGIAPLISGSLIRPLTDAVGFTLGPYTITGFHLVFLGSCILRASGLPLVNRLQEPENRSIRHVIRHIRTVGIWGLRSPQR
jgi:MFS family permease